MWVGLVIFLAIEDFKKYKYWNNHSKNQILKQGINRKRIRERKKHSTVQIQTVPSVDAETRRVVIHWHIDKSVTSPSCLPMNWTPSTSFSTGHLRGSSADINSLFPTFIVSILSTCFPIPTTKISCKLVFRVEGWELFKTRWNFITKQNYHYHE